MARAGCASQSHSVRSNQAFGGDLRVNRTKAWIRIAYCRDIPLREGRPVKVGNREIAIFNLGDRFLAVDNRCPHKGAPPPDGIGSGACVVCPLHAWKISLETGEGANSASASNCVET